MSESARMSSAAEARFRIPAATVGRVVTVVALDPACDEVVASLGRRAWNSISFFPSSALAGDSLRLLDEMIAGDLVVMLASAGADAPGAEIIGRACSDRRVHTATFVVRSSSVDDAALSKTLAQVRPWSLMVVIAGDDHYVEEMLRSFR
jgi:hypothetical protein